jgi:hypothetical protein
MDLYYSLLQVRNLTQNTLLNPTPGPNMSDEQILMYFKNSFSIIVPNSAIQPQIVNLQTAQTKEEFLRLLPALRAAIDAIIPPVHSPRSLNDILSELLRFQSLTNSIDQQILFVAYLPMISYFLDVDSLRDALGTPQQSAYINAFVLDFANKLTNLKSQVTLLSPPLPPFGRTGLTTAYLQYRSSYEIARNDVDRLRTLTAYRNFVNNIIDGQTRPVEQLPTSVTLTGFYAPSIDPTSKTFMVYISDATSGLNLKQGMIITGLNGIQGRVLVKSYTSNVYGSVVINPGPPSISFPYVSVVTAIIKGKGTVPIAPSSLLQLTFKYELEVKSSARVFRGPVDNSNTFSVYVVAQFNDLEPEKDWTIEGLTDPSKLIVDVTGTITVNNVIYESGISNVVSGTSVKNQDYIYKLDVTSSVKQTLPLPGSVVTVEFYSPTADIESKYYSLYDPKIFDPTDIKGQAGQLRDLNSNVSTTEGPEVYHTVVDRGSGIGALISMAAIGAQEPYMFGGNSKWIPEVKQHTAFSITQRLSVPLANVGGYLGKTVQVDLFPRECGDLLSNMYLQCSLPAGYTYTELTGRAIIDKVEFMVDGVVYESITDDWYVIHDQLFLDADEKLGLYQAVSNGTPEGTNVDATGTLNLIVPLDFFFCDRFKHGKKRDKPYFPLCALKLSTVSVRFTFNTQQWITSTTNKIDLINPRLIIEEIHLSARERMYYQFSTLTFKVPRVWKESSQTYSNGLARLNFTAKFPVAMMVWFVRNKLYETQDRNYFESRYSYGYTTEYIQSATPVTFFNGVSLKYIDTIDYATMYLNNTNVLSNFPGGLYYTFKQPLDHGLSVPTKSLYMYCFSERPTIYNSGGTLDFKTLNSQTSHLDIKFLEQYAPQIASNFSLNLFYYGYVTLNIQNGVCTLL